MVNEQNEEAEEPVVPEEESELDYDASESEDKPI